MTDESSNLVLEHLKRIRASQERMELDVGDLKARASGLELHQGQMLTLLGSLNQRLDRLEEPVSRIERRLDLVDAD